MDRNTLKPKLRVSLIIPAYNEEKYIGACLDSISKNATDKFCEIIVVDNASTDKTASIAGSYTGVRVLREERKGPAFARDTGYHAATGDIIAFIDADTVMPRTWYTTLEKEFCADKALACLSGPYRYYDTSPREQFLYKYFFWYAVGLPAYWLVGYMAIFGNCALRKDVLEQMGGLDTTIAFYGDDTDVARRAHAYGRVLFSMAFTMDTSARRLKGQGVFRVGYQYVLNFLSVVIRKRPATAGYSDIR